MTDLDIPPVPQDAKLLPEPEPLSFKLRRLATWTRQNYSDSARVSYISALADEAAALEALAHARRKQ